MTDIEAINVSQRAAIDADGNVLSIATMLDHEGDECGPEDAVALVIEMRDGTWASCLVDDFEKAAVQ